MPGCRPCALSLSTSNTRTTTRATRTQPNHIKPKILDMALRGERSRCLQWNDQPRRRSQRSVPTTPPRATPTLRQSTKASKGRVVAMMGNLQYSQNHSEVAKAPRAKPQRAAHKPEVNNEMPVMEILKILVQRQGEATYNRKVIGDLQSAMQKRDELYEQEEMKERPLLETQQLRERLVQETWHLKEDICLLQAQLSQVNSRISLPTRSYATIARTNSLTPSARISQQASNTSTSSNLHQTRPNYHTR